jgi:hypothetical protein
MKFIIKILQSFSVKYLLFTDKLKGYDLIVLLHKQSN